MDLWAGSAHLSSCVVFPGGAPRLLEHWQDGEVEQAVLNRLGELMLGQLFGMHSAQVTPCLLQRARHWSTFGERRKVSQTRRAVIVQNHSPEAGFGSERFDSAYPRAGHNLDPEFSAYLERGAKLGQISCTPYHTV